MTTKTFWHVAPADYIPGTDLLCWDALVERGAAPMPRCPMSLLERAAQRWEESA